jgi:hypothetical protein
MATRLGIDRVEVHPVGLIRDTTDPEIVPLGTPKNDLTYDPEKHGPRPYVEFDREVFYAYDLLFHLARRPSVRLRYKRDPITDRSKPSLVREFGPMGWPVPTRTNVARTTRDAARKASRSLPDPARKALRQAYRALR